MKQTKIVVLTSAHPPFDIRIFQKECQTLVKAGYEVVLVVPHNVDSVSKGITIRAVPPATGRFQRMTRTSWKLFKTALKEKGELYHLHDPELLPWAQLLRLLGKEVIYDMHENVPRAILTKSWIPSSLRSLAAKTFSLLERVLLYKIPVIFAEDSYAKDYPWIGKQVVVLNMPLVQRLASINSFKYPEPTLGYIGGVTPERGSLTTLEALRILKEKGLNVALECIGPICKTHQAYLEQHAFYSGLQVRVRGYLLPHEAWPIIARCQIGLALLKPIPNYLESYPTKIFEYMALGLPVLASNFPLYRKTIEEEGGGLCVNPEDPEAIAQAIQWLLEHPEKAVTMGLQGREAVGRHYNWAWEASKLLRFYEDLVKVRHLQKSEG